MLVTLCLRRLCRSPYTVMEAEQWSMNASPSFILRVRSYVFFPSSAPSAISTCLASRLSDLQQLLLQDCCVCPTVAMLDTMARAAVPPGAESKHSNPELRHSIPMSAGVCKAALIT